MMVGRMPQVFAMADPTAAEAVLLVLFAILILAVIHLASSVKKLEWWLERIAKALEKQEKE